MFFHVCIMYIILITSLSEASRSTLSSSQLFTFAQPQSFLQLKAEWPLHAIREVTFKFRTDRPHGLLLYHGSTTNQSISDFPFYELYVMLERGHIKIIHVFHSKGQDEIFDIGRGLNQDKWHHVTLRINTVSAHLFVRVDDEQTTEPLPSLSQFPIHSLVDTPSDTVIYFGGLDPNNTNMNQKYNYVRFVGCLGNIVFGQHEKPSTATKVILANQLYKSYVDQCIENNPCLYRGQCINHYTHTSCDCFGTGHEDKICFRAEPTTVTFRGYSHITYRIYDWRDRVHSEVTRISFNFRTFFEDSVLMYAAENPSRNYIAMSLFGGQLYFEIDFGDGPLNATIGYSLNDERWHTLTMLHHGKEVTLQLDARWGSKLVASGPYHHLHLDPEISIGSAPKHAKGLKSREKFIGCLRSFYFNDKSVLYSLYSGESTARYKSIFAVEYGCDLTNVIPMTFPLPESKLVLTMPSKKKLQLSLEFKTSQPNCVLASGEIRTESGMGIWELMLHKGVAIFIINPRALNDISAAWSVKDSESGKHLADDEWHQVGATYDSGEVKLEVDYRHASKATYIQPLEFMNDMILTTSAKYAERGFIGCMKDIYVSGDWIDPRTVIETDKVSGKVSLDNCLLVDLCNDPYACEHGGKCYVDKGETECNCTDTGYDGKTCHFARHKRTCQELYLVGIRKSGIYKIDIDRNGPLPPANVYCDIRREDKNKKDIITTKVENNMPHEMVVRKKGMESFYIDVSYREFTPVMLQTLIKHSKTCSQEIRYDCFRTPLGLRTYTWMQSSGSNDYITSIGSQSEGCKCAETRDCANASLLCNCDIADNRWRVDEGVYTNPRHLGITRIYVLQPVNLDSEAEGRITLGPLNCLETDTQEYVITFKTWNSYVEVPGWRRGDIAFSFRTSNNKAVLIYQSSIHLNHGYLRVLLINEHEMSFEYTVDGKPESKKLFSRRKLNSGQWQQVWVDHDTHHMRFTVNEEATMVDFGEAHGVGPFEGALFVGGVAEKYAGDSAIKEGFIGCFRGLVINDQVIDLYKHMTRSESAIVLGCQPSCASSPCKNDGTCHEYWGSYKCECLNPYAHSGKNCEKNVNTNGMTVVVPRSYYHHKTEGNATNPVLEKNILLSFRTFENEGLLLYAFDHFNNFVQLHFADNKVYFTFNSDRTVYQVHVQASDISKGSSVQVKIERHSHSTNLIVDKQESTVNVTMKFVDRYFRMPWIEGAKLEIVFPPRGTYRTIDHSEMFLGHVGSGTETNFTKRGFTGCIQGFVIGDKPFDLTEAAATLNPDEKSGLLKPGCNMLCDGKPCENNGLCIEHWKENMTSCDCSLTSYTGEACQKDIGGSFDGQTTLIYLFDEEVITEEMQNDISIRLAFSTEINQSAYQVLIFVQFKERKYILIGIADSSVLFIEEHFGDTVVTRRVLTESTWSDGHRHWFYFAWKSGTVTLIVDGHNYYNSFTDVVNPSPEVFEGTTNIFHIAGLPKILNGTAGYINFKGCISNVMMEFGELKLMPLETTFGYRKGSLDKIKVDGSVSETKCALFASGLENMPSSSSMPPEIQGRNWYPDPPVTSLYKSVFADMTSTKLEDISRASSRVAAVMGVLLIIVILGLLFYIYRIQKRYRRERMGEDYHLYKKGKRRPTGIGPKGVSFATADDERIDDYMVDSQPLVRMPPTPPAYTASSVNFQKIPMNSYETNGRNPLKMNDANSIEMAPLRSSSSQELEWDPAGAQLVSTAMDDMNPEEAEAEKEYEDNEPLPELKNQFAPLASTSEVTINRLSQTFA